jgi:hypothetical protein
MLQFGGKDSKRHFTVVMGGKEHGLYVSSTPSSAARKAVTKLCAANKSKKVEFEIREITQGSKKKTYGPYKGYIEKLKEPIELKGRVIKYKPVAKLSGKSGAKKGGKPNYDFYSPKLGTPEDYEKQKKYLSRFPQAFQKIIIDGLAPSDPYNKKLVDMNSTPITNKKELYDYLYNKMQNIKYWKEALSIVSDKSMYSSLYKIITKLNEYDQSNTPSISNSILLQTIEKNKQIYPTLYESNMTNNM